MAKGEMRPLTQDDLDKAALTVADIFLTDEVVIVGSQALLVQRDDIDRHLRQSIEIDIFARGLEKWVEANPSDQPSETISALVGENSQFHGQNGYFIDGVDETTARLPRDWMERQVVRHVQRTDGPNVRVIAPSAADIIASKLIRGEEKDRVFASRCLRLGLTTLTELKQLISKISASDEVLRAAERHADNASKHKNDYVASKGPDRPDAISVMLERLKSGQDNRSR